MSQHGCVVDGCAGKAHAKGYCPSHYARLKRWGDPHGSYEKPTGCAINGCDKPHHANGYCSPHAHRLRKYGDPLGTPPRPSTEERFWTKVDKNGPLPVHRPELGRCWQWRTGTSKGGYALFSVNGKNVYAHRWIYEREVGELPAGHVIDHLCRNRRCVNPSHLEPVTNDTNLERGLGYGLKNGMREAYLCGHPFTPDNTYLSKNQRWCRTCALERAERYRNQKKDKQLATKGN